MYLRKDSHNTSDEHVYLDIPIERASLSPTEKSP
jgi:hypothetical protein